MLPSINIFLPVSEQDLQVWADCISLWSIQAEPGQTTVFGDRGWLAVALVIFALWKPLNAIWGAFLFGALYILYLYIPGLGRSMQEVFKALPYVVTIIVLVFTSFRKKKEHQPPAGLGLPYFREER